MLSIVYDPTSKPSVHATETLVVMLEQFAQDPETFIKCTDPVRVPDLPKNVHITIYTQMGETVYITTGGTPYVQVNDLAGYLAV